MVCFINKQAIGDEYREALTTFVRNAKEFANVVFDYVKKDGETKAKTSEVILSRHLYRK